MLTKVSVKVLKWYVFRENIHMRLKQYMHLSFTL